jgi:hypothetical protein
VSQSSTIVLASGIINRSGDQLTVVLVSPNDSPNVIRSAGPTRRRSLHLPGTTKWPAQPFGCSPLPVSNSRESRQTGGVDVGLTEQLLKMPCRRRCASELIFPVACGIKTNGRDRSDPTGKRKREARLKCRQRVGCLGRSEAGAIGSAQFPDVRHDENQRLAHLVGPSGRRRPESVHGAIPRCLARPGSA